MKLINGKEIAAAVRAELKADCATFVAKHGYAPGLAVVIVGEDPASQIYVRNKARACEEVGFCSEVHRLPAGTEQAALNALIDRLNADSRIHGILVQLPLPAHLDAEEVTLRIDPRKDVDAFHPFNVGRILLGDPIFLPCTPAGVMELLRRSGIDPSGKRCVVIGRSNICSRRAHRPVSCTSFTMRVAVYREPTAQSLGEAILWASQWRCFCLRRTGQ